jgi:uncharacterized protein DUF5670
MIPNMISFIEALLIFAWMIGYFGYHARGIIHLLLILAILIIAIRIMWHKIIV